MKHEIQCIKLKDLGLIILVIFSDPAKYYASPMYRNIPIVINFKDCTRFFIFVLTSMF